MEPPRHPPKTIQRRQVRKTPKLATKQRRNPHPSVGKPRRSAATLPDASKLLPKNHPKYWKWIEYLSSLDEAAHRFNSARVSLDQVADYTVEQFDRGGQMLLETVYDYKTALECGKAIDRLIEQTLGWFRSWRILTKSPKASAQVASDLRRRLLRRGAYWKAEAHATCLSGTEETQEQRAARRQSVLQRLWQRAGIVSDDAWAARAGANVDRNTPRDYRSGKTKRLRGATRQALAEALGVAESELPA